MWVAQLSKRDLQAPESVFGPLWLGLFKYLLHMDAVNEPLLQLEVNPFFKINQFTIPSDIHWGLHSCFDAIFAAFDEESSPNFCEHIEEIH